MMPERSYWYIAAVPLLSVSRWAEVASYEDEVDGERMVAPMLFTNWWGAEAELRWMAEREADAYLQAVQMFGEEYVNDVHENLPEQQVFEIGSRLLGEYLKGSGVAYVVVDGRVLRARELAEELRS